MKIDWIWDLYELPPVEKFVLIAMAHSADGKTRVCSLQSKGLLYKTGYSYPTIREAKKGLVERGLIEVIGHNKFRIK